MADIEEILTFWFDEIRDEPSYFEEYAPRWFVQNADFDRQIVQRFQADYELAAQGQLTHWAETARGGVALILVLDQFPRNMFRNDPRAFATDPLARQIAEQMIAAGLEERAYFDTRSDSCVRWSSAISYTSLRALCTAPIENRAAKRVISSARSCSFSSWPKSAPILIPPMRSDIRR